MGFTYPWFLLAAGFMVVPLILHLLERIRARPQVLPTLEFLKQGKSGHLARRRPTKLLLLLLRMGIILLLALLFAAPFVKQEKKALAPGTRVLLAIDNSPSMGRLWKGRSLLEHAREAAIRFVRIHGTRVELYAAAIHPFPGMESGYARGAGLRRLLQAIRLSPTSIEGRSFFRRYNASFVQPGREHLVIVFSDGQPHFWNNAGPVRGRLRLSVIGEPDKRNMYVSSLQLPRQTILSGEKITLDLTLSRLEEAPREAYVRVFVGERAAYEGAVPLPNRENRTQLTILPTGKGPTPCRILIRGDDFVCDNQYVFVLNIHAQLQIALAPGLRNNRYLTAALRAIGKGKLQITGLEAAQANYMISDLENGETFFRRLRAGIPGLLFVGREQGITRIRTLCARNRLPLAVREGNRAGYQGVMRLFPGSDRSVDVVTTIRHPLRLQTAGGSWQSSTLAVVPGAASLISRFQGEAGDMVLVSFLPLGSETEWVFHNSFPLFLQEVLYRQREAANSSGADCSDEEIIMAGTSYPTSGDGCAAVFRLGNRLLVCNQPPAESRTDQRIEKAMLEREMGKGRTEIVLPQDAVAGDDTTFPQLLCLALLAMFKYGEILLLKRGRA